MLEMQLCLIYVRFIEAEKKVRKSFQTLQMTEGNSPMPEWVKNSKQVSQQLFPVWKINPLINWHFVYIYIWIVC